MFHCCVVWWIDQYIGYGIHIPFMGNLNPQYVATNLRLCFQISIKLWWDAWRTLSDQSSGAPFPGWLPKPTARVVRQALLWCVVSQLPLRLSWQKEALMACKPPVSFTSSLSPGFANLRAFVERERSYRTYHRLHYLPTASLLPKLNKTVMRVKHTLNEWRNCRILLRQSSHRMHCRLRNLPTVILLPYLNKIVLGIYHT